ncbi:hypothetical protein DSO57_1006664 [Entomophthora muscae]|uniref:Uncharacterized protein n=1 Tax=Entomophthora muscae TaxID=34485 RepID=A0ACC2SXC3_9FUNG|nr:hypothetical protein DSO57_1006664 [Entomophthora muscae]
MKRYSSSMMMVNMPRAYHLLCNKPESYKTWLADGTFSTCSKLFSQLWNIHGQVCNLVLSLCDDPHVWWFASGANVGQEKVWLFVEGEPSRVIKACLVGNKGLPEADVASIQQKELAAWGYSASPCKKLWLQKSED